MFNSLRFRSTLIFVGLAVVPLILVGGIVGQRGYTSLVQQSLALQREVAASVGGEIRAFIEGRENELVLLDQMYGLGVLEPEEQRVILDNLLLYQQVYQEVTLLDSEGREQIRLSRSSVVLDDDLESRAESDEFLLPVASGKTYFGPVRFDETIREPLVTISVPLFDQRSGEVVSILVTDLRFKTIWDLLAAIELPNGGDAYVIDQAGQVVAHRNPAIILRGTVIDLPEADGRTQGLSGTDVVIARYRLRFADQEIIVVAEQPVSSALGLAIDSLRVAVAVTSAALALAVLFVVLTTHQVVRPIEALATSARAISGGDFSQQVQVSDRGEIEQLASAFNQMMSDLEKSRARIEEYTLELKSRNEELQRDIIARVRAEEALRESTEKIRAMFKSITDGITFGDLQGNIVDSNEATVRMHEFESKEELIGRSAFELIAESDQARALENLQKALATGRSGVIEYKLVTKTGREFDGELNAVLLRDEQGNPSAFVALTRDISERKRAEEALKEYSEQLEEMVEQRAQELRDTQAELIRKERLSALGQLTATVAHEIRNPLGTVRTSVFVIGDAIQRDDMGRFERARQLAEHNIIRCDRIITELLDYTRDRALNLELTNIDEWLDTLLDEQVTPGDIVCEKKLSAGAEVAIDREHLRRAVINVVENAVDALQGEGRIGNELTVSSHVVGSRVEIRISDTGPGIPADVMDKVFEPLFSTKTFGVGLGLPIVKNIMEQHGGGIEIESRIDEGTTVMLWLPIVDKEEDK